METALASALCVTWLLTAVTVFRLCQANSKITAQRQELKSVASDLRFVENKFFSAMDRLNEANARVIRLYAERKEAMELLNEIQRTWSEQNDDRAVGKDGEGHASSPEPLLPGEEPAKAEH